MTKGKGRELEEEDEEGEDEHQHGIVASTSLSTSLSTPTTSPQTPSHQFHVQAQAASTQRQKRQAGVGNVNEGYPQCNNVGNNIASCYPDDDAVLQQNQWSKFIWNPNYVTFLQKGYLDIYLYSAGSEETLANWRNISNSRGSVGILPGDDWLPTQTTWTQGSSITHSYYFVVATQGAVNPNGLTHQATFRVVQTAAPTSLTSILAASSSAGAAAASLASASSSLNSVLSSLANEGLLTFTDSNGAIITGTPGSPRRTGNPSSSLQGGQGNGSDFPKWAIAVIVVLGVLALIAALVAAWVILRALRRKNDEQYARAMTQDGGESLSATPIMAEVHSNDRPASGAFSSEAGHTSLGSGGAIAGAGAAGLSNKNYSPVTSSSISATHAGVLAGLAALAGRRSSSPRNNDDEYYNHRRGGRSVDPSSPLAEKPSVRSLASAIAPSDAAIISDAFRNMLRKPEFPERERENSGSSGEENGDTNGTNTKAEPSPSSVGTATPAGFAIPSNMEQDRREYSSGSDEEGEYKNSSSDEENTTKEADEMIKTELASEGTSVRSIAERKRPDIRHD